VVCPLICCPAYALLKKARLSFEAAVRNIIASKIHELWSDSAKGE
jgi:hypothetical protein